MNTYRITNITNTLGKRNANFNSVLKIDYVDEMEKKSINLKPNEVIYFTSPTLPLSLHKYRVKKLISIEEVSPKEFNKIKNANKPKKVEKKKEVTTTTTTRKRGRKPTTTTTTTKK